VRTGGRAGAVEIFTTGAATDLTATLRELVASVDDQLRARPFWTRPATPRWPLPSRA
jgi:hypothetical protein